MAALGFFRRHQKFVMVLMVVLMIAFLIPTSFKSCSGGNQASQVIGKVGSDKITVADTIGAQRSIRILEMLRQQQPRTIEELFFAYFLNFNPEKDRPLNWALLLHEARSLGLKPSETQAKQLLTGMGLEGDALQNALTQLAHSGDHFTEADLYKAAEELTLITQSYLLSVRADLAPSLPELKHDFRDLREKLDLAMVTIPAENFIKDAPEPSPEQVQQQFEQYKDLPANSPENKSKFGFGYRVPDRLDIQYLAINTQAISQSVVPTEDQMLALWHLNGDRMIIKAPSSEPASAPTSRASASEPAEETTIVIDRFSEAKPALADQVRIQQTELKANTLLNRSRDLVGQFKLETNPYLKAAQALLHPADDLLAKPVPALRGESVTLSELISQLDDATGVRIVYPFGKHENFFLDGSVKVKIDPKWAGKPLGEVLNQIADAHKYPRLTWVTCDGLSNAIFPSQPIDGAPVAAGGTGMVSVPQAAQNQLLLGAELPGQAKSNGSTSLLALANSVFSQMPGKPALLRKGEDSGRTMVLEEPFTGKMIWRLADYDLAHTPKELTPEIRQQVVHDLKVTQAFTKAEKTGQDLQAKVQSGGNLELLAKTQNLDYSKTGLIARKGLAYTGQFQWTSIPGVGINPEFIEQAFKLAPPEPDRVDSAPATELVPLSRAQTVFLLQRIGYEPARMQEFMTMGLGQLLAFQSETSGKIDLVVWFNDASIVRRTGYVSQSGKVPTETDEE